MRPDLQTEAVWDAVVEADLLGHLLQGATIAESVVAEMHKDHAQTLVLKMAALLLKQ